MAEVQRGNDKAVFRQGFVETLGTGQVAAGPGAAMEVDDHWEWTFALGLVEPRCQPRVAVAEVLDIFGREFTSVIRHVHSLPGFALLYRRLRNRSRLDTVLALRKAGKKACSAGSRTAAVTRRFRNYNRNLYGYSPVAASAAKSAAESTVKVAAASAARSIAAFGRPMIYPTCTRTISCE